MPHEQGTKSPSVAGWWQLVLRTALAASTGLHLGQPLLALSQFFFSTIDLAVRAVDCFRLHQPAHRTIQKVVPATPLQHKRNDEKPSD